MKFSEATIDVLKNFSGINQSMIFKPGQVLKTINPTKSVIGIAEVDDEMPAAACVYDMARFLSVLSLYEAPEVEFQEKSFLVSEGRSKTNYFFADPSMVVAPPEKELKFPDPDVTVSLTWEDLQGVIKAASVLQLPEIAFVGEEGKVFLRAIDSSNPSADAFGVELGETEDTFTLILKAENLKVLPAAYEVSLSSKGISKFDGGKIRYYIAIEAKSTYSKG